MTTGSLKQNTKTLHSTLNARLESDQTDQQAGSSVSILRTIFQLSPGLLFYLDKDGVILNYLSDNTVTFFSAPDTCVGKQIADVLPENISNQFLQVVSQTQQSGLISSLEYDWEVGDRIASYSARCVQVHDGNQVIMIRDISSEKKLANSAHHHQKLMGTPKESAYQLVREMESKALGMSITRTCIEQFGIQQAWLGWMETGTNFEELGNATLYSAEVLPISQLQPSREEVFFLFERKTTLVTSISSGQKLRALFPLISDDQVRGVLSLIVEKSDFFTPEMLDFFQAFNRLASSALKNARMYEDSRRQPDQMQPLRFIDQAILSNTTFGTGYPLDIKPVAEILLKETAEHLQVDALALLVLDPKTQTLDFLDGYGFHDNTLRQAHLEVGEGFAGQAAQEKRMVYVRNLQENPQPFAKAPDLLKEGFVMYLGAPLIAHSAVQGVLEIFQRRPFEPDQNWLDQLESLANQIAIAIDNAQHFAQMVKILQDSNIVLNAQLFSAYGATMESTNKFDIESLSRALELRDHETAEHAHRVAKMTVALARKMGIQEDNLQKIHQGAILHDIGKIGIPDAILLKPDSLLSEEWLIMKQHPLHAYQILSKIEHLKNAIDIPLYHHEKWDGSGYPYGLKGNQIPRAARIFAVVDVYDALTSTRPYRAAWGKDQALIYIQSQSNIHFDREVVLAFSQLLRQDANSLEGGGLAQPKKLPPNFIY